MFLHKFDTSYCIDLQFCGHFSSRPHNEKLYPFCHICHHTGDKSQRAHWGDHFPCAELNALERQLGFDMMSTENFLHDEQISYGS